MKHESATELMKFIRNIEAFYNCQHFHFMRTRGFESTVSAVSDRIKYLKKDMLMEEFEIQLIVTPSSYSCCLRVISKLTLIELYHKDFMK